MLTPNLLSHAGAVDLVPAFRPDRSMMALKKTESKGVPVLVAAEVEVPKTFNISAIKAVSRFFLAQQYLHDPSALDDEQRKKVLLKNLDSAITGFLRVTNLKIPEIDLSSDEPFFLIGGGGERVHSSSLFDFLLRYAEQSDENELRRKFFIPNSRIFARPKKPWRPLERWTVSIYLAVFVLEVPYGVKLLEDWRDVERHYENVSGAPGSFDLSYDFVKKALSVFTRLNYLSSEVGSIEDLNRFAPEVSLDEARSQILSRIRYEKQVEISPLISRQECLGLLLQPEARGLLQGEFPRSVLYGQLPAWIGAKCVKIFQDDRSTDRVSYDFELIASGNARADYDIIIDLHDYIRMDPKGFLCRKDIPRLFTQRLLELLVNPLRQGSRVFVSATLRATLLKAGRMDRVAWAERSLPSYLCAGLTMLTPTYKDLTGNILYKVQYDSVKQIIKVPTASYISTPGTDSICIKPSDLPFEIRLHDPTFDQEKVEHRASWRMLQLDNREYQSYIIYGGTDADR